MNTITIALLLCAQEKPFLDDSAAALADALARAKAENRRVLIVWGLNDSAESIRVHSLLAKDPALKKLLLYEFDVVRSAALDGAKKFEADVAELPAFTILAADGSLVANEKAAAAADAKALHAALEKHKAAPWVAKDLYDAALKKSKESKKRLFLHFGAPW
jgi:hypothetical protein